MNGLSCAIYGPYLPNHALILHSHIKTLFFFFFSVVGREIFLVGFGSNRIELIKFSFYEKDEVHSCLSTTVKIYGGWTGSSIDLIQWNSHSFFHTSQ